MTPPILPFSMGLAGRRYDNAIHCDYRAAHFSNLFISSVVMHNKHKWPEPASKSPEH